MKFKFLFFCQLWMPLAAIGQFLSMEQWLQSLQPGPIPADLLATKTVVLYQPNFTGAELESIQTVFERTGIDAITYLAEDVPTSNMEVLKVFARQLTTREVKHIALLQKNTTGYGIYFTAFDGTPAITKPGQSVWGMHDGNLNTALQDVYRTAANSQPRKNFLVSPKPEMGMKFNFIKGNRGEYYAVDLRSDKLAIVKTGEAVLDQAIEAIFKAHYPFAYQIFEAGTDEKNWRDAGCLFVLSMMHTRGQVGQELLGYPAASGTSITGISFPNGQVQLKTMPASATIFKFYLRHLVNQGVYLGPKWDADPDPTQALLNQIKGLKIEWKVE